MTLFFVSFICAYQSYTGPACNAIMGAYWQEIRGDQNMDRALKKYVNPYVDQLPFEAKSVGIAAYAWYNKRTKINLYRNLYLEISVDRYNVDNRVVESTNNVLLFSRSF